MSALRHPKAGRGDAPEPTLIDALIAEQGRMTAVEQFSRAHDRDEITTGSYQHLLPLSAPAPGEQYAFEVELDKCSGCKACVTACHSLNGLDEGESWRDVGLLVGEALVPDGGGRTGNRVVALQQTVTTACHHCVEPACLLGCPVLAYDKDPLTGIVRHLDDQCIGCSYCILKCPYDVPKYSARRGIVRKCDMCHGRLAAGEAPACVQACPNEAIRIGVVKIDWVRLEFRPGVTGRKGANSPNLREVESANLASTKQWLPDAPPPALTLPTTLYRSHRSTSPLRSADHGNPRPEPAHAPLVAMLVLTQAGIGGLLATLWLSVGSRNQPDLTFAAMISAGVFFAGLAASALHLGRPTKAWRVWLGWRTSWLSREAIALNVFAAVAIAVVVGLKVGFPTTRFEIAAMGAFAAAALLCQAMVYADTGREFWRFGPTAARFVGSTLVLGLGAALVVEWTPFVAMALVLATLLKLAVEVRVLKHADSDSDDWPALRRTAVLQRGPLRGILAARLLLALAGGIFFPVLLAVGQGGVGLAWLALGLCLLGELAERWLFFTSVSPIRMPNGR